MCCIQFWTNIVKRCLNFSCFLKTTILTDKEGLTNMDKKMGKWICSWLQSWICELWWMEPIEKQYNYFPHSVSNAWNLKNNCKYIVCINTRGKDSNKSLPGSHIPYSYPGNMCWANISWQSQHKGNIWQWVFTFMKHRR